MRILLLGEYSGFYSNLKRGFSALGHEVLLCAARDGFKEVDGLDVTLNSRFGNKYLRKFDLVLQFLLCFLRARNYDAVFWFNNLTVGKVRILSTPSNSCNNCYISTFYFSSTLTSNPFWKVLLNH